MNDFLGQGPPPDPDAFEKRIRRRIFGAPRDPSDPKAFHKIALLPFFAWIGLGADGLSSSAYGPEEAFRALGSRPYLAIFISLATAITVLVISYTYTKIIEHFPNGGGGYLVATRTLSPFAGLVSGSALIVDYVLTITVSIASSADAIFSYLPPSWLGAKVTVAAILILVLVVMNIRGVKESVELLAPIFIAFLITHAILLAYGIGRSAASVGALAHTINGNLALDVKAIGTLGILMLVLRAYSLGGGTYTGIEAVSNGIQILREPHVKNGKRTMALLAGSLAITAGGLVALYLLAGIRPEVGRTLNATLADALYGGFGKAGLVFAAFTVATEGALLLVGAQAGFIDAPRVMANMAVDNWLPRRFANFSERLTMRNGIVIIGLAAAALLIYTHGSVAALVVMYSINVFLTFSLSEFGMTYRLIKARRNRTENVRILDIAAMAVGFVLCVTILAITIFEKFTEGGWLTLVITGTLVAVCAIVKSHYGKVRDALGQLDNLVAAAEMGKQPRARKRKLDPDAMTAIQLVSGYNGLGVHTFLQVASSFPGLYKNYVFISVALVDQAMLRDGENVDHLRNHVDESLERYAALARGYGLAADWRSGVGTSIVETASSLCGELHGAYPKCTVFVGNLIFEAERPAYRVLYNETAFAIQARLQWEGIPCVVMPIRVWPDRPAPRRHRPIRGAGAPEDPA
jgi:amino acid transporter